MRVSVNNCGYLAAVHAARMAKLDHDVVGIDVDEPKMATLDPQKWRAAGWTYRGMGRP